MAETNRSIHAAVLKYEVRQFLANEKELPVCVSSLDPSLDDASFREMREHFASNGVAIWRADQCDLTSEDVLLASSRRAAALVQSGPVEHVGADEAHVRGGFRRQGRTLTRPTYRVVREAGRWVCLGPIITGVPL